MVHKVFNIQNNGKEGGLFISNFIKLMISGLFLTLLGTGVYTVMLFTGDEEVQSNTNSIPELSGPNDSLQVDNKKIAESYDGKAESPPHEVRVKVEDMIHRMSHQKVRAESKWGHLKITDEHLNEVIELLKKYNVHDRTLLHEAMLDWQDGDFSNAVKVHNRLKQPQGSDAVYQGKAYGLLYEQEEQSYIDEHFQKTDDIPVEEDEEYQNRATID